VFSAGRPEPEPTSRREVGSVVLRLLVKVDIHFLLRAIKYFFFQFFLNELNELPFYFGFQILSGPKNNPKGTLFSL
jgi:hypothetical protein